MSGLEKKDYQIDESPKQIINQSHVKELHDIIWDFVDTHNTLSDQNINNDVNFDWNQDYQKDQEWNIQEIWSRNISPELLHLKDNLNSPQIINTLMDSLLKSECDKETLLNFLNDQRIVNYFTNFNKYDIINSRKEFNSFSKSNKEEGLGWDIGWVDKYSDYKDLLHSISKKFNDLKTKLSKELSNKNDSKWIDITEKSLQKDNSESEEKEDLSIQEFSNKFPELTKLLSQNNMKELIKLNENLRNNEVDVWHIDFLDEMANFYKPLLELPTSDAINKITSIIENSKIDEAKKNLFKKDAIPLLTAILEKKDKEWNSVMKEFVKTIDKDIKWLSYDLLLTTENLNSNDVRKSINTIFHRDEQMFNKLVEDFNKPDTDPQKKLQIENIIKEYVKLSVPDWNPSISEIDNAIIKLDYNFSIGKLQKPAFIFTKKDGSPLWIVKKDQNWDSIKDEKWNDILSQKITPFFGDRVDWKSLTLKKTIEENDWVKEAMEIWTDNMKKLDPKIRDIVKETINTKNWPKSITEAISSLFESWLRLEIKQAFMAFMAMTGSDSEKQNEYAIESNFAQAEKDISKIKETIKDKNDNSISYLKALRSLNLQNKKIENLWWNPMEIFSNAPLENQKRYIESVVKDPSKRYDKDKITILGDVKEKENQHENANTILWTEIKDNKAEISELKVNEKSKWLVEIKWDYIIIDGQIIPIVNGQWAVFTKQWSDIIKKTILIKQNNEKKDFITIIDQKKLEDVNPKSNDLTNQDWKMFDLWKYNKIDQWPNAEKLANMITNLPAWKEKNEVEKAFAIMKNEIDSLATWDRTKDKIIPFIDKAKKSIDASISQFPDNKNLKSIVEWRSSNVFWS